jgi:hypothetical protein
MSTRVEKRKTIRIWRYEMPVPRSPWGRITLGSALCFGGLLGFLPILGFWMLPLGIAVLSYDIPAARRVKRWMTKWWRKGHDAIQS